MSIMKRCLACGRCVQRTRQVNTRGRGVLCLLTHSPFRLRLMLLERLAGHCTENVECPRLIWRG